jgi:ABC-2 type transport system permease protein
VTGLVALTERAVRATLRDDLPFAILAPVGNFVVFYFVLRDVFDTGQLSYSQYVLPVVIIQAMFLGALTTVDRATSDQQMEFGVRLRTLPIPPAVPLMARMTYCLLRGILSLAAAIAIGYAFGFRILGGFGYAIAFAALVLVLTLAISLAADAAGSRAARAGIGRGGASSQLFLIPQMLLVMLSTGMAPIDSFPDWLHPFVEYQPVSQMTQTLRGFAGGQVWASNLMTSVAWCVGLLVVFGALALRMQSRKQ